MRLAVVIVFAIVQSYSQVLATSGRSRIKRFSIFSLVQFPNSQCISKMSTDSTTMMGTCLTSTECNTNGGTVSGGCASGFGTCCVFSVSSCGSTVSKNCTYIQNPGFPSKFSTVGTCTYTFQASTEICQIRLDLDDLILSPPILTSTPAAQPRSTRSAQRVFSGRQNAGLTAAVASCLTDTFTVTSPSGSGVLSPAVPPVLCGVLSGSHMYFETGRLAHAGTLSITTGTTAGVVGATALRSWKIKVTQIECGNPGRAPTDCTQYYTSLAGTFQSYNFNNGQELFIQNQYYSACFRQAEGYCKLAFNQDPALPLSIFLELKTNGPFVSKHTCISAGLMIPTNAEVTGPIDQQETYCGAYLNQFNGNVVGGSVFATVTPWNVLVFSRAASLSMFINTMLTVNKGFKLNYQQIPCA